MLLPRDVVQHVAVPREKTHVTELSHQVWPLQSISLGTVTICLASKYLLWCTFMRTLLGNVKSWSFLPWWTLGEM